MNKSCLKDNLDWLIYADYLDDQNINHFVREDLQNEKPPWHYDYFLHYGVGYNYNQIGIHCVIGGYGTENVGSVGGGHLVGVTHNGFCVGFSGCRVGGL
jgi:hypothetical protein